MNLEADKTAAILCLRQLTEVYLCKLLRMAILRAVPGEYDEQVPA